MKYRINTFINDSVSYSEFDNLAEAIEDWTDLVSHSNVYTHAEFIEVRTQEIHQNGTMRVKEIKDILYEHQLD